jgi:hypothetical protein
MSYTVIIENKAQKYFLKLPPPHDGPVKNAMDGFANEPQQHGVKKLSSAVDAYR